MHSPLPIHPQLRLALLSLHGTRGPYRATYIALNTLHRLQLARFARGQMVSPAVTVLPGAYRA